MYTSKLRGKNLNLMKPQTKYAKVPMCILSHPNLTPVDKLIFAYLYSQSDSGAYKLAYTRIAKELNIDKSNLIKRWKWFIQKGYIKEDENNFYVIIGAEDKLQGIDKGSPLPPKQEGNNGSPIPPEDENNEVGKNHLSGGLKPPTQVVSYHLNGSPIPPNEHNKEEKIKSEQGVEMGNLSSKGEPEKYVSESNHTSSQDSNTSNDLEFLINNSPIFKNTYENATLIGKNWHGIDISKYSNAYIAYLIGQRVKNEPIEIPRNIQNMLTIMVRFSQKFEESNLWKCFLSEIENNPNYIQKLNEF